MKMLKFAAGLAVGYVLGARAGRGRYQQIVEGARSLADQPAVAQAQEKVTNLFSGDEDRGTTRLSSAGSTAGPASTKREPPSQRSTTPPAGNSTPPAGSTGSVVP
ncbi:MAG TPA: hypothetical protein VKE25_03595 [Actinomycetes bacterium]|nr:hypothetical protein [Actinomycetes bacterium]